jgi:hypothetical protein
MPLGLLSTVYLKLKRSVNTWREPSQPLKCDIDDNDGPFEPNQHLNSLQVSEYSVLAQM